VAGHLGTRPYAIDPAKTIIAWPEIVDRLIDEMR
jgi:hypothetical protein